MDRNIIIVPGDLDTKGAMLLEEQLSTLDVGQPLTLDLTNVNFIASTGIRIVMKIAKSTDLLLTNASLDVKLVFMSTGLDRFLRFN